MKTLLTLTLLVLMGTALCSGQLFAAETPDDGTGGDDTPELYTAQSQWVLDAGVMALTEDGTEEEPDGDAAE